MQLAIGTQQTSEIVRIMRAIGERSWYLGLRAHLTSHSLHQAAKPSWTEKDIADTKRQSHPPKNMGFSQN